MDSAHSQQFGFPSTSTTAHATSPPQHSTSPTPSTNSKRYSEPTPGRQRRLLRNRNAKFPAQELSLSNLGSRFTQLIHANNDTEIANASKQNIENCPPQSSQDSINKKRHTSTSSLGILEELSSTTLNRRPGRSGDIPIFLDTPERPLLERSSFSSPATYQDSPNQDYSPIDSCRIQDNLGDMRLREISSNEHRGSSLASSPFNILVKPTKKRKSFQTKPGFDTQEYIEHLEKELQNARSEMISPNTNRSLKDQLQIARHDNERLQKDMSDMRDMYEAEVKRTLEHKAMLEVEMKRQVRDLEEELELKMSIIEDLELQHDERRLDNCTIDTLKAAIERLEQEKISLTDENCSVSKRNEVLSELLAMSPTKMQNFELRSPIRERRATGRPMSMILPKIPTSPTGGQISQAASAVASPSLSTCGSYFNLTRSRAGSPQITAHGVGVGVGLGLGHAEALEDMSEESNVIEKGGFDQHRSSGLRSRRSTLQSQASLHDTASIVSSTSSPIDQVAQRVLPKRKPRKFMSGSTQLKPLLLPALNGDVKLITSSVASSPLIGPQHDSSQNSIDPTTCFLSLSEDARCNERVVTHLEPSTQSTAELSDENAVIGYESFEDIITKHRVSASADLFDDIRTDIEESSEPSICEETILEKHNDAETHADLPTELLSRHIERPIVLNQELAFPNSTHAKASLVSNARSVPHYVGLDFNALNSLNFPDPEYDALPVAHAGADETLLTDVPQPLFSIHANHQHSNQTDAIPLGTQLERRKQDWSDRDLTYSDSGFRRCSTSVDVGSPPTFKSAEFQQVSANRRDSKRYPLLQMAESVSSDRSELPQRSTLRNTEYLAKTKSPLDILRSGQLGAKPLAALTIRTIFGTIAQYTGHLRDLRKDPLALARRVIANAWFSNWARFGRLSWWVLGLFVSSGFGGPKLKEWDWGRYDGEEIARRACQNRDSSTSLRSVTSHQSLPAKSHVKSNNTGNRVKPSSAAKPNVGWGKSLLLWGKFSIAIMLAVGGAVVKGPAEMLKELDHNENDCNICSDSDNDGTACRCSFKQHVANNYCSQKQSSDQHKHQDHCPTPAAPSQTGKSPSINSSQRGTHVYQHGAQDFQYTQQLSDTGNDETLRANPLARTHVADFFQHVEASSFRRRAKSSEQILKEGSHPPDIDSGTVRWPPSPGPIYPQDNYSIRRRNS